MATHVHSKYKIPKFWDIEYKTLPYEQEEFNDAESLRVWRHQGYTGPFTGYMCDMRKPQPSWNSQFINIYKEMGWKGIGTSYYRMDTGTVLPTHSDLYTRYVTLHNLQGLSNRIRRAVVFLEDWKPGHYSEINGIGLVNWEAGTVLEWDYDTPHAAANIGIEPRYTLQITGWV
jgi:hypothetical protein